MLALRCNAPDFVPVRQVTHGILGRLLLLEICHEGEALYCMPLTERKDCRGMEVITIDEGDQSIGIDDTCREMGRLHSSLGLSSPSPSQRD